MLDFAESVVGKKILSVIKLRTISLLLLLLSVLARFGGTRGRMLLLLSVLARFGGTRGRMALRVL